MINLVRWLLLSGWFLILLPPVGLGWMNTALVGRGLVLVSGLMLLRVEEKLRLDFFLVVVLGFLVVEGLSGLVAVNKLAFAKSYLDLWWGSIGVVVGYLVMRDRVWLSRIVKMLLFVAVVNGVLQLSLLLFPWLVEKVGVYVFHKGFYELMMLNVRRSRLYVESIDEALIPFLIMNGMRKREWRLWLMVMLIVGLAVVSNFRTRMLLMMISVLFGFLLGVGKRIGEMVFGLVIVLIVMFGGLKLANYWWNFDVVDRLLLSDRYEDVLTLKGRWLRWQEAWEMGKGQWLGVGLGNYYDNLDVGFQHIYALTGESEKEFKSAVYYPHNVFFRIWAESGWLGLVVWLGMLVYFGWQDWRLMRLGGGWVVVGFWVVGMYAWINPGVTVKYWSLFWIWRLLSERYSMLLTTASE